MDADLKRRLVGATVLIVAALIFVPMLFDDEPRLASETLPVDIPTAPERDFESRVIPLDGTGQSPSSISEAMGVDQISNTNTTTNDASIDETISTNTPDAITAVDTKVPDQIDAVSGEVINNTAPSDTTMNSDSAANSDTVAPSNPPPSATNLPLVNAPVQTATKPIDVAQPTIKASVSPNEATKPNSPIAVVETIPPISATGRYLVNLGSFSKRENANLVIESLKNKGIRAFTETISVNGQPALRLRAGPFSQRAEAERVRLIAKMARSDIQPSIVERDDSASAAIAANKLQNTKPSLTNDAPLGNAFAVQVGAFSAEADAKAMQAKLKAANFPAYVEKISAEAGSLWRVRVGPVPTRVRAEQILLAVKQKSSIDGRVVTHP